jgi:ribokinase
VTAAVGRLNRVDVVVGQLEIPQPATVAALEAGRQRGAVTVLNPAPAIALHAGMLAATDWLVPNEDELDAIGRSVSRPPDPADDGELVALAEVLGVQLVITLGAAGVVVVGRDAPVARITADAVSARDTTGAGDAFVGAFAAALALGRDAVAAATWASRCATASVQRDGAQSSYPSAAQVAELAELVG